MAESGVPAVVLVCGDLSRRDHGIDLQDLSRRVTARNPNTVLAVVEGLCRAPVEAAVAAGKPLARIVLGLCSAAELTAEQESALREAGHDPLRVDVLDLGGMGTHLTQEGATAKASLLVVAAIARAAAAPTSMPPRLRPRIPNLQGALGRRSLFTLPVLRYQPIATVQFSECVHYLGCELCVASCPVDALAGNGRQVRVDAERCIACGNCLPACPRGATDLAGDSGAQIAAAVEALLATEAPELPSRAIAYVCRSDATGLERLRPAEADGSAVLPVRVPCIGMLPAAWLLAPLAAGAEHIYVVACGSSCKPGQQARVAAMIDYCQELLEVLGLPRTAVSLVDMEAELSNADPGRSDANTPGRRSTQRPFGELWDASRPGVAISELAAIYDPPAGLSLAHTASPLGLVTVNPETCTGCGNCARVCPTDALIVHEKQAKTELTFDATHCIGCELCVDLCPERRRQAIGVERITDIDALRREPATVFVGKNAVCERCGAVIGPLAMIKRIERTLRAGKGLSESAIEAIARRCNNCTAATPFARAAKPGRQPPLLF